MVKAGIPLLQEDPQDFSLHDGSMRCLAKLLQTSCESRQDTINNTPYQLLEGAVQGIGKVCMGRTVWRLLRSTSTPRGRFKGDLSLKVQEVRELP